MKLGEGRRAAVRYDLSDLEKFMAEKKKRVSREPASQALPVVAVPAEEPTIQPDPPVEPRTQEPDAGEPPAPSRRSPPRTMWEALAERVQDEPEDDPFASNVVTQRRGPGGYFGG